MKAALREVRRASTSSFYDFQPLAQRLYVGSSNTRRRLCVRLDVVKVQRGTKHLNHSEGDER